MRQFHLPPCGAVSCADGAAFPGARRSVSPVNRTTMAISCLVEMVKIIIRSGRDYATDKVKKL